MLDFLTYLYFFVNKNAAFTSNLTDGKQDVILGDERRTVKFEEVGGKYGQQ